MPCESEDLTFDEKYGANYQELWSKHMHEILSEATPKNPTPEQPPDINFYSENFCRLYEEILPVITELEDAKISKERNKFQEQETAHHIGQRGITKYRTKTSIGLYSACSAVGFLALAVGCGAAYHRRADITETLESRLGGIVGNDNFRNDNFNNNLDSHNLGGYNSGSYNRDSCNLTNDSGLTDEGGCAGEYIPENCLPEEPAAVGYAGCGEEGVVYCGCDEVVCNEEETYSKEFPAILSSKENALAWTIKPASSSYLLSITSQEGNCN